MRRKITRSEWLESQGSYDDYEDYSEAYDDAYDREMEARYEMKRERDSDDN